MPLPEDEEEDDDVDSRAAPMLLLELSRTAAVSRGEAGCTVIVSRGLVEAGVPSRALLDAVEVDDDEDDEAGEVEAGYEDEPASRPLAAGVGLPS